MKRKRNTWRLLTEARHASFAPFVTSIDGVLSREVNSVMKLSATKLALKLENPLSEVTGWVKGQNSASVPYLV